MSKKELIGTIRNMKNKHAIEAYKFESFKSSQPGKKGEAKDKAPPAGTGAGVAAGAAAGAAPAQQGGTGSGDTGMLRQTTSARIYRGSTINSIMTPKGFLKTGYGHKRAAKLLLLLGMEQAAEVLRHLSTEEVEKITAEIAKIKRIDREEARKILEEFGAVAGEIAATPRGGVQVARDILEASLGKEKALGIIGKLSPYVDQKPFAFLNTLEYQQIMLLLRKEPIHVVSIVISYLKPEKASQVLESLPPEVQARAVRRIARLGRVSPEVLSSIEDSLRERIRTQGKVVTEEIDGQTVLADILKHLPLQDEDRILDSLETRNNELAEEIREKLFTIEMILDIPEMQLQGVLQQYPDRDLAILLKGKSEELEKWILRNVSERRGEFIREERKNLGPMKRSEVDRVTKDFLLHIRSLVERGDIVIDPEELV